MTDMTQQDLSFAALSDVNRDRCESTAGFSHRLDGWRPSQWTNAMAGEVGEACNLAKKLDRHEDGTRGNLRPDDQSVEAIKARLGRELGDVVIYADLTAQRLGLSLAECVRAAFNEKSDAIGFAGKV